MNSYRIDKTKTNDTVRYELLQNGRFVFSFDADDLAELRDVFTMAEAGLWAEDYLKGKDHEQSKRR